MVLSKELLAVLRQAVAYAIEANREFVSAIDVLLALMDEAQIGPPLREAVSRERVAATAAPDRPPKLADDDDGSTAAFPKYFSMILRTPDGTDGRWLDSAAYGIFLEGARRVEDGPYLPKHLLHGYVAESIRDYGLMPILGANANAVQSAINAMSAAVPA